MTRGFDDYDDESPTKKKRSPRKRRNTKKAAKTHRESMENGDVTIKVQQLKGGNDLDLS